MPRRSAVVLTILLLLAGCSATQPQRSIQRDGSTVTPAPVPESTNETVSRHLLAPGIGPTGVIDPIALSEAHEHALTDRAFIRTANRTITTTDGAVVTQQSFVTRVGSTHRVRHTVLRAEGPQAPYFGEDESTELWTIGDRQYQAIDRNNETSYRELPSWETIQPSLIAPPSGAAFLVGSIFETNVSARPSGRALVLTGNQLASPSLLSSATGVQDPHNASLRAVIRRDGLVRSYSIRFSASAHNRPIEFSITVRYARVGNPAIGPPPIPANLTRER